MTPMTREDRLLEAAKEIDDCATRLAAAYVALGEVLGEYAHDAWRQAGGPSASDVTHVTKRGKP